MTLAFFLKFYVDTVKNLYKNEVSAYFNCAKSAISKQEKNRGGS
jgi:hypothetical protein